MVQRLKPLSYYQNLLYYFGKILRYRNIAKAQEMNYWKNEVKPINEMFFLEDIYHRQKDIDLALKTVKSLFNVFGREIKVLDIGPGPRSSLIKGYEQGDFDLVGIDPLADDYKHELGGGDFLNTGKGEDIEKIFPSNSFHLVYASNSLDHCEDPRKVILGIFQILKSRGILIVCGNEKEGMRSRYQGYHKHNLWIEGETLIHSNMRGKASVLVGEGFRLMSKRDMVYDWQGSKISWFLGMWQKQ
jgi:SAM-dependent methyltransferase